MFGAKIYQPASRNSVISPQATKITPQGVTWGDVMWMWNKSLLFLNWKISIQPNSRKKHKLHRGQWARSGEFSCALLMLQLCPVAGQRNPCVEVMATPLFLIKCIITKPLNSCFSWRMICSVQQPHTRLLPSGRLLKHKGVFIFSHTLETKVPRKSGCSTGQWWHFSLASLHPHRNLLQDKVFQNLKYFQEPLLKI